MPKKWKWIQFYGSLLYLPVGKRHVLKITALTLAEIDFHVIYANSEAAICVQDKKHYWAIAEEAIDNVRNKKNSTHKEDT